MGAPVNAYSQLKPILDALAQVIGGFDPNLITRDQRVLLHASAAPSVVILLALLTKTITVAGVQVPLLTLADLQAARDAAYADPSWPTVAEP